MATYTSHYNLKKPATGNNEPFRTADQNGNMDLIDAALWALPATKKGALSSSDDANSISDGIYYLTNSLPLNVPSDMQYCFLIQISNSYIKQQIIFRPVSGDIRFREYSGTPVWQAWQGVRTRRYSTYPTKVTNSVWSSGTISIHKRNGTVLMKLDSATFTQVSSRTTFATIPAEYRPPTEVYFRDNNGVLIVVDTEGNVKTESRSAGSTWGSGCWITDSY